MLTAYTESILQLKPTASTKRKEIVIPRQNGSYDRSKYSKRPERHDRLATDNKSYSDEYLASASSVFFRQTYSYPRSFLWRVVAKQKILEISTADFARNVSDEEADLTIALEFQDPISPRGISFCDAGNTSEFHAFVLTRSNEVFEIHLRTAYFQDSESIPQNTLAWCAAIPISALSIDQAFQLHATNPQDLFISFTSGKIQHWRRDDIEKPWTHANYDDKKWGSSLLSIVSRKGLTDIDFEGMRLAVNTACAIARSGQYLFTACLNHTLRIWHLQSGRIVDTRDLLDQARDANERVQLNPANPGYIQFLEGANKHEQILLTYSPLNGGQIKLWRVRNSFDDDTTQFSIEDMVYSSSLQLPDPDPTGSSVWSLSGLRVIFDKQTKDWQAWVVWRNHNYHKAYSLNFGFADISKQWRNDWVEVSSLSSKAPPPDFVPSDSQDATSKWLEYILFPDRYSTAVLETAVAQYAAAANGEPAVGQRRKSLEERMESLVTAQVTLRKYEDSSPDYGRFAIDTDQQWRQFWRILEALNETRFAPLALSVDPITGMTFLSMTDACCAIRECSNLELLQKNTSHDLNTLQRTIRSRWPYRKIPFSSQDAKDVSAFLAASDNFWSSFPPDLEADFMQNLEEDLFMEPEVDSSSRIVNFYNQIDFANSLPDDVEQDLYKDLSLIGGVKGISSALYNLIFDLLSEYSRVREKKSPRTKTAFGVHLTMTAVLEQIIATRRVLLAMLAIAIFLDGTEQFDTADAFERTVGALKTQERDLWLATHYRKDTTGSSSGAPTSSRISIMQSLFGSAIPPQSPDDYPMPYILTQHIRATFANVSGVCESSPDDSVYLQCNLLRHGDLLLATDFLKFQPSTAWSTYIKGRLYLALGNNSEASTYFKQAAGDLSGKTALGQMTKLSSGLLSADEATHFNNGFPSYYDHIEMLFEAEEACSDAALFARLALNALEEGSPEPTSNFKQNMLSRLFKAEVKCSKFEKASEAIVEVSDPTQQKVYTTSLVDAMLNVASSLTDTAGIVQQIQDLPLSASPHLVYTIDQHIALLAKSQTSIPTAGGLWLSNPTMDYLSVLHALRLARKDYRGAASVLFDRLRIIQKSGRARSDPQAVAIRHALLALINLMTCVGEDEAYIIANISEDPRLGGTGMKRIRGAGSSTQGSGRKRRRIVITLDDLRREYQQVLDRCSRIERGDFDFDQGSADSDDDDGEDGGWEGSLLKIDRNVKGALQLSNGGDPDPMQIS